MGLVGLNVSLLELNAQAGRNAEKVKALRIQNAELRARVSRLASADRLERAGRELGLAMSIAGRVRYLSVRRGDARRAARAIRTWGTLPTFAFAPLPEPPPAIVPQPASTQGGPAVGATGASGAPAAGVPAATGVTPGPGPTAAPQATAPAPGTATTPASGTTPQPGTQPVGGGQALTGETG
jgi:hypothetical protein